MESFTRRIAYIKSTAKSDADILCLLWMWLILRKTGYFWANVGFLMTRLRGALKVKPKDPFEADCSGAVDGAFARADLIARDMGLPRIRWSDGGQWHGTSAEGLRRASVPVTWAPGVDLTGCIVTFNVPATHVVQVLYQYKGGWYTGEERRGAEIHRLNDVLKRKGASLRRFPWLNLGVVTVNPYGMPPKPPIPESVYLWKTGPVVSELQGYLRRLGYPVGVTGVCGPVTVAGIRYAQKRYGLTQTGYCGPVTWAHILDEM